MRVVIEGHVVKTVHREKPVRNAEEQIVCDRERVTATRLIRVVGAEQLQGLIGVLHDIVCEADVLDGGPRRKALFAADCEQDGVTDLRVSPAVFERIAVDDYVARILKLEQVFDCPVNPAVTRIAYLPRQRFEEVVMPDLDRSEEHTSELQSHSFISYA